MKKPVFLITIILLIPGCVFAQEKTWQAGLYSFFDNIEFGGSEVKVPQTMSGIMLTPEVGLKWDSVHRISAGINIMHEFGSRAFIDNFHPLAYYEFSKESFRFIMGAFPRSAAADKYPRIFFQDSLSYYRPNIEGLSVGMIRDWGYVNLWLDWTGRQAEDVNEAFLTGINAEYRENIFYLRHSGYMFHFASKKDPAVEEALHDNLLFNTSIGIDLSGKTFLDRLDLNAGWVAGLERARSENTGWVRLRGMLIEARAAYRGIGIFSTYYRGDALMYFYGDHGNDLYWGDPAYRAGRYNRTDMYINFLRSRRLDIEFTWSLHFLESRVYHEQMLKVRVQLDNIGSGLRGAE